MVELTKNMAVEKLMKVSFMPQIDVFPDICEALIRISIILKSLDNFIVLNFPETPTKRANCLENEIKKGGE